MKKLLIALLMAACLVGCASFEKNLNSEKILVQVATMKVIEKGKTADEQKARADKIVGIASEARSWLTAESVTVDLLKSKVYARLDTLDLQPSDRLLANLLVDTVVTELETRVVNGVHMPVPPEQFVYQVDTVLSWIETSAKIYQ